MRVFLDTNVWLSATVFSGLCDEILQQCAARGWLYSSKLVRHEAHEVLQRKFPQAPRSRKLFDAVWQAAQLIDDVAQPPDDNDARLVAAATAADMEMFVTGDKRVLRWKHPRGKLYVMRIEPPRRAWQVLFGPMAEHSEGKQPKQIAVARRVAG